MSRHRGFTLAELAVAFFVIALLLSGALMPLSTQIEVRNVADTRRGMDSIRDALTGFAQANGRLPCPARAATPAGTVDAEVRVPPAQFSAGVEQYDTVNGRCYSTIGVVPWTTLGVAETDAWGRRYTYRVAPVFADAVGGTWSTTTPSSPASQSPVCTPTPTPTQSSFALCTLGDIAVLTRSEANHATVIPLGSALAAVVVSHGKNGKGAFQTTGLALTASSANTDEWANSTGTAQAVPTGGYLSYVFYSRPPTPDASACDDTAGTVFCEFDDIVVMISSPTLVGRMVSAGRLP